MLSSGSTLWQVFATILAGGIAFNILGTLVVGVVKRDMRLLGSNDLGGNKFGFLEPITGLVAAFVVTMSWVQYSEVVGRVQRETASLVLLKESAGQFSEPGRSSLLAAIATYAEAVAGPEWQAMAIGGRSEVAGQALAGLARAYGAAEAHDLRDENLLRFSLPVMRRLSDDREGRLEAVDVALRGPLFALMGAGTAITIAFIWFFGYPTLRAKLAMGTLFTAGLMIIVFMAWVLAHPFRGPIAVSNAAYVDIAAEVARMRGALEP